MRKLLIGLLAIGTLSAQASMQENNGPLDAEFFEAEVTQNKTYFETLGDLFTNGTLPNLSKISNIAWAGRCFYSTAPNTPENGGYIFREKTADTGPISRGLKTYEAITYSSGSKAPNYYDIMNLEQALASALKLKDTYFKDARVKKDSIEVNVGRSLSNLKVSGNYLVEEISAPHGNVGSVGKLMFLSDATILFLI